MQEFLEYIENQDKEGLKSDLKELYSSYEFVRNYYRIKFSNSSWNEALISQHKEDITKAISPNKHMQGGLDFEKVESIVEQLNSKSTIKYYIEAALHGVEECTNMANEYGGDFGDDFYIYFEELFEKIVEIIVKENLKEEYKFRLKEMADNAFEGYGHHDHLRGVYTDFFE